MLHVVGPSLLGQPAFSILLASFQLAVKEKTPETLRPLVAAARATKWRALPEAFGPLAEYAAPECLSEIASPGVNTDAALIVLLSLISHMEVMTSGAYRVEHDQEIEFRETEITTIEFPLELTEGTQAAEVIDYFSTHFFASRKT